jgi:hypothetical protein
MPRLSDAQRLALTTAAERADGAVLPLPKALAVHGRARDLMLQGLIKRGLIAERPTRERELVFAQGDEDRHLAFEITREGRALIGRNDRAAVEAAAEAEEAATAKAEPEPAPTIRPGTKQALLVDLLRRPGGATIAEVQDATGWQPHSARAAIAGLRKKRLAVTSAPRGDGTRAYHLPPEDTDQDAASA